ncbi:MAG: hypothetical protein U0703_15465 [Anaerolineae bacterium]
MSVERARAGLKPQRRHQRVKLRHVGETVLAQVAPEHALAELGVRRAGRGQAVEVLVEVAHGMKLSAFSGQPVS